MAEQACRKLLYVTAHSFSVYELPFVSMMVKMYCYHPFGKTRNRLRTQNHSRNLSNFILSSRMDPNGDQNDVHHLLVYECIWYVWCCTSEVRGQEV